MLYTDRYSKNFLDNFHPFTSYDAFWYHGAFLDLLLVRFIHISVLVCAY